MTDSRLGPNSLQGCPSQGCSHWHLSHGFDHRCGVDEPSVHRFVPTRRHVQRDLPLLVKAGAMPMLRLIADEDGVA